MRIFKFKHDKIDYREITPNSELKISSRRIALYLPPLNILRVIRVLVPVLIWAWAIVNKIFN